VTTLGKVRQSVPYCVNELVAEQIELIPPPLPLNLLAPLTPLALSFSNKHPSGRLEAQTIEQNLQFETTTLLCKHLRN